MLQQYDNDTELSASEQVIESWITCAGRKRSQNTCTRLCCSIQDKVYERFLCRIAEDGRRKIEAVQSFGEDKILFVKGGRLALTNITQFKF